MPLLEPAFLQAIILSVIAASTPLLLAAAGELVAERAGVLNLGLEGMMIMGAACGFAGAYLTGSTLLGTFAGVVAGMLTAVAIAFYVVVYTMLLKRRTAQNIVWGGAAGCMPVFIGWAAVTGSLAWAPVALFAVVFFWTPPHFWALAMKFRDDYAAANVPMLPVVASPAVVARKIVVYSYAMVAATLALVPYAGWIYGCCAFGLGAWFLVEAHQLRGRIAAPVPEAGGSVSTRATGSGVKPAAPAPMRLFHLSIAYLTLLFAAVAVTALLPWGRW